MLACSYWVRFFIRAFARGWILKTRDRSPKMLISSASSAWFTLLLAVEVQWSATPNLSPNPRRTNPKNHKLPRKRQNQHRRPKVPGSRSSEAIKRSSLTIPNKVNPTRKVLKLPFFCILFSDLFRLVYRWPSVWSIVCLFKSKVCFVLKIRFGKGTIFL